MERLNQLFNVLCVPDVSCNLFSISAAMSKGNRIKFKGSKCIIWDPNEKEAAFGVKVGKLYEPQFERFEKNEGSIISTSS